MEGVLWSGQCSAGKPWVLHSCECYFDMCHLFKDHIHLSWQWCSLKAVVTFSRIMHLPHCRNYSGMIRETWQRVQGVALASKFFRSQPNRVPMGYAGPKNPSMPRQIPKQSDFTNSYQLGISLKLMPYYLSKQLFLKLLQCSNKMRGVIFRTAAEN